MITQADIVFAVDGAALVALPRTGMDPRAETVVSVVGTQLRVGQGAVWFVDARIPNHEDAEALARATVVEVTEADENGFEFHENVRKG